MRLVVWTAIVSCIAGMSGCRTTPAEETEREISALFAECQASGPTREQFEQAVAAAGGTFRNEKREEVEQKLAAVREGMTKAEVEKLVGKPSFVEPYRTKDGFEFGVCEWRYVFTGKMEDGKFFEDEFDGVGFDRSGQVIQIPAGGWKTIRSENKD